MNQSTKMENIVEYIKVNNIDFIDEKYILYGRKEPTNTSLFLFGGLGALTMKQYILVFGKEHLTLIWLSMTGDFKNAFDVISYNDIFDISYREGMLTNVFTFYMDDEKLKIKCNKKVMGMHWQSTNMNSCLAHPAIAKYV